MAYQSVSVSPTDRWLVGLSTDTKPVPEDRDRLHQLVESDTGNEYKWTGLYWQNTAVKGAKNIHDAHVHNLPVDELFHYHTGITTTVEWEHTAGARILTVDSTALISVGDDLNVAASTHSEATHSQVTAILATPPRLVLDRPLDNPYTYGDSVEVIVKDLAVVGDLYAPISYKMEPPVGDIMHVQSFILGMAHSSTGDDSLFGNLAALQYGCILRGYNGAAGRYRTLANWKTNGDIKMSMYDLQYTDKAGGGLHSTVANGLIGNRTGAVPELSQPNGDFLEVLIQDNISALEVMQLKGQGHVEGR